MPQETCNGAGIGGTAANKEPTENEEHRDREQTDRISSFGEYLHGIDPKSSQGKTMRKDHQDRQGETEKPESIIPGIKCPAEGWPAARGREVGTHAPRVAGTVHKSGTQQG